MSVIDDMREIARRAKSASRALAVMPTQARNDCLLAMANALEANSSRIEAANALDMADGEKNGLSRAMLDRLKLDAKRVKSMANGLREVAALPDPVGRKLDQRTRPNGLKLEKISTPIGVIVIIYESRPNVTADAASLCFKSANATILRGGKEALNSNKAIAEIMIEAAKACLPSFPVDAIQVVPTADREAIPALLSLTEYVDLCMPRGGEGLIRAVAECSKVPVIKHYKGVCHVYVDSEADLNMAEKIIVNAKVQRPGVCNAMECLIVNDKVAKDFLPRIASTLTAAKVELRVDDQAFGLIGNNAMVKKATPQDWSTEYLDLICSVKTVDSAEAAENHINTYGSGHSDTIVTSNEKTARQFMAKVDSATVYWNASTRFTDGGEFGMGAEIGISTDKIGARGPMGLEELTTYKWLGYGTGQIRG
ncbi:MAG: proA [Verrucomicrobiales bacterium]|nr:proA [Verrucomicrobiales bacterium]